LYKPTHLLTRTSDQKAARRQEPQPDGEGNRGVRGEESAPHKDVRDMELCRKKVRERVQVVSTNFRKSLFSPVWSPERAKMEHEGGPLPGSRGTAAMKRGKTARTTPRRTRCKSRGGAAEWEKDGEEWLRTNSDTSGKTSLGGGGWVAQERFMKVPVNRGPRAGIKSRVYVDKTKRQYENDARMVGRSYSIRGNRRDQKGKRTSDGGFEKGGRYLLLEKR